MQFAKCCTLPVQLWLPELDDDGKSNFLQCAAFGSKSPSQNLFGPAETAVKESELVNAAIPIRLIERRIFEEEEEEEEK